ncbi:hypothetical protein D8674_006162 [Pyrus ussuriensis x Pyrus communis]|uniref:Uncharacterized protein n=1 Tax=Pyrus ussuriensis x Pyrus communis TaxID=2448454 RepID=A0A5N5FTK0_9ROSA|nr:hypothetical protein D8674_006162 [Pyrus ussuriensis x Pyrus communis]
MVHATIEVLHTVVEAPPKAVEVLLVTVVVVVLPVSMEAPQLIVGILLAIVGCFPHG